MKKILIVVCLIVLQLGSCTAEPIDGTTKAFKSITFISDDPLSTTLENGVVVAIADAKLQWRFGTECMPGYYSTKTGGLFSSKVPIELSGINVVFRNSSNDLKIIKWAESNIAVGSFSCLPFLEGVKWANAGNPSALPDTILAPGQSMYKVIYLSRVMLAGHEWQIIGEQIPKDNSQRISLYLKIADSNGTAKYYTVKTPTIGINE